MEGLGDRLRARAKQLGLPDAEVARRLGLGQSRYAHYVTGTREPDFATLLRICRLLVLSPNELLGYEESTRPDDERSVLLDRVQATSEGLDLHRLRLAANLLDVLAKDALPNADG